MSIGGRLELSELLWAVYVTSMRRDIRPDMSRNTHICTFPSNFRFKKTKQNRVHGNAVSSFVFRMSCCSLASSSYIANYVSLKIVPQIGGIQEICALGGLGTCTTMMSRALLLPLFENIVTIVDRTPRTSHFFSRAPITCLTCLVQSGCHHYLYSFWTTPQSYVPSLST